MISERDFNWLRDTSYFRRSYIMARHRTGGTSPIMASTLHFIPLAAWNSSDQNTDIDWRRTGGICICFRKCPFPIGSWTNVANIDRSWRGVIGNNSVREWKPILPTRRADDLRRKQKVNRAPKNFTAGRTPSPPGVQQFFSVGFRSSCAEFFLHSFGQGSGIAGGEKCDGLVLREFTVDRDIGNDRRHPQGKRIVNRAATRPAFKQGRLDQAERMFQQFNLIAFRNETENLNTTPDAALFQESNKLGKVRAVG